MCDVIVLAENSVADVDVFFVAWAERQRISDQNSIRAMNHGAFRRRSKRMTMMWNVDTDFKIQTHATPRYDRFRSKTKRKLRELREYSDSGWGEEGRKP